MDSLSQMALGAAVADLTLGARLGRRAMLLGAALGTLPDLDVLIRYEDAIDSFTLHRGFSHSLFVLSLVSLPVAAVLRGLFGPRGRGVALGHWWFAVWAVLITHPLLDAFTSYGTQLFWPIPVPPVAIGSVFIIDLLYTAPLLIALVFAWRRRERAPRALMAGLALSSAWLVTTLVLQQVAERRATTAWSSAGISPADVRALPFPGGVLWRVIARDGDDMLVSWTSFLANDERVTTDATGRNDAAAMRVDRVPLGLDALGEARALASVQRLEWFTGGYVGARTIDGRLVLTDLRIGSASQPIFSFDVAARVQDGYRPEQATARPVAIEPADLRWLLARVTDAATPVRETLAGERPQPGAIVSE